MHMLGRKKEEKIERSKEEIDSIESVNQTSESCSYQSNPRCREWESLMDESFHGSVGVDRKRLQLFYASIGGWTATEEIHSSTISLSGPFS